MMPVRHSAGSLRASAEEFLLRLDEHDEPDPEGYFRTLPSNTYFSALRDDHPGTWDALVRNMSYGLDHFPPGRVLDIGCGHGLQSFVFARHGHEVIGLDTAESRTVVSNRIAEAAEMPWLRFMTGNARDEVGTLSGSSLWMHRSFHHIPERTTSTPGSRAYPGCGGWEDTSPSPRTVATDPAAGTATATGTTATVLQDRPVPSNRQPARVSDARFNTLRVSTTLGAAIRSTISTGSIQR